MSITICFKSNRQKIKYEKAQVALKTVEEKAQKQLSKDKRKEEEQDLESFKQAINKTNIKKKLIFSSYYEIFLKIFLGNLNLYD